MMAVSLGKRKRAPLAQDAEKPLSANQDEEQESMKALFQKHFESRFRPLEQSTRSKYRDYDPDYQHHNDINDDDDDSGSNEDDWSGFSSEDEVTATVVEHVEVARDAKGDISRQELRAFLSSKVPLAKLKGPERDMKASKKKDDDDGGDEDSSMNLKNDLALQRLLTESHLLSNDKSTNFGALEASGKSRHKTLDLRLQALGSKESVFAQQKMPMNIRKGMVKKHSEREQKRRNDAKDAGIILEREVRAGQSSSKRRDRGVDGPAVGRFKRGMLTLNRNDLKDIQSTRNYGPRRR